MNSNTLIEAYNYYYDQDAEQFDHPIIIPYGVAL